MRPFFNKNLIFLEMVVGAGLQIAAANRNIWSIKHFFSLPSFRPFDTYNHQEALRLAAAYRYGMSPGPAEHSGRSG